MTEKHSQEAILILFGLMQRQIVRLIVVVREAVAQEETEKMVALQ